MRQLIRRVRCKARELKSPRWKAFTSQGSLSSPERLFLPDNQSGIIRSSGLSLPNASLTRKVHHGMILRDRIWPAGAERSTGRLILSLRCAGTLCPRMGLLITQTQSASARNHNFACEALSSGQISTSNFPKPRQRKFPLVNSSDNT